MENLKGEEGILERLGKRESEALVPDGAGRTRVIGFGGETTIRVDPEDNIGLEIPVFPVDVLEMLGRDDGEVEIQGLRWRRARRRHAGAEEVDRLG